MLANKGGGVYRRHASTTASTSPLTLVALGTVKRRAKFLRSLGASGDDIRVVEIVLETLKEKHWPQPIVGGPIGTRKWEGHFPLLLDEPLQDSHQETATLPAGEEHDCEEGPSGLHGVLRLDVAREIELIIERKMVAGQLFPGETATVKCPVPAVAAAQTSSNCSNASKSATVTGDGTSPLPPSVVDIDSTFWMKDVIPTVQELFVVQSHFAHMLQYVVAAPIAGPSNSPSNPVESTPPATNEQRLSWLAIGDWGACVDPLFVLSETMALVSEHTKPSFILSLGDNFYPDGAQQCDDDEFKMWKSVFLKHEALESIPWKVVLGNHDYNGNPQCQIDFTNHPGNPDGLWQMPSRQYSFQHTLSPKASAAFIAFDTNVVQWCVRNNYPDRFAEWPQDKKWLREELRKYKDSTWKIYFAHHPFYTRGLGHIDESRCLRGRTYKTYRSSKEYEGMDLESILVEEGVDLVISGHEHTLQRHIGAGGILHACCGGTIESFYWKGQCRDVHLDWHADRPGFGQFEIVTTDNQSTLIVRFLDAASGAILHQVERVKPLGEMKE